MIRLAFIPLFLLLGCAGPSGNILNFRPQKSYSEYLNKNGGNSFMDYNNIQFNSSDPNIYITKGDVLFYNYINPNENIRNNLYNTIKMFLAI